MMALIERYAERSGRPVDEIDYYGWLSSSEAESSSFTKRLTALLDCLLPTEFPFGRMMHHDILPGETVASYIRRLDRLATPRGAHASTPSTKEGVQQFSAYKHRPKSSFSDFFEVGSGGA